MEQIRISQQDEDLYTLLSGRVLSERRIPGPLLVEREIALEVHDELAAAHRGAAGRRLFELARYGLASFGVALGEGSYVDLLGLYQDQTTLSEVATLYAQGAARVRDALCS